MAKDTTSDDFIIQESMQAQLENVCASLTIPPAVYMLHGTKEIHRREYYRYYGCLTYGCIGSPAICVGRWGKSEYDACEDVAAMLMHCVLSSTGRRIQDFNFYNVEVLDN